MNVSDSVEFGDNDDPECLVEGGAYSQTCLIGAPVEGRDGLGRHDYVLDALYCAHYSHLGPVAALLHSGGRVRTGKIRSNYLK